MRSVPIDAAATVAEIVGRYGFWAWLRLGKPARRTTVGVVSLVAVAWLLTLVEVEAAGRAYAVHGGIFVAATPVWLRVVEEFALGRRDIVDGAVALAGAAIILWGPRGA